MSANIATIECVFSAENTGQWASVLSNHAVLLTQQIKITSAPPAYSEVIKDQPWQPVQNLHQQNTS